MKTYTIRGTHHRIGSGTTDHYYTGTLEELTQEFSYILKTGKSYERERGNKKINLTPKTISSLAINLTNARDNADRSGYSGWYYVVMKN